MQNRLPFVFLSALLLCGACNSSETKPPAAEPVAATAPAASAPTAVQSQVARPQVGDVYVVQFQPQGTAEMRYFFYHLYRVTPDSAYLHPARKEATDPAADLTQPDFQPSATTIAYTRAELVGLLKLQPGDVLKTQLIQVRRAK
ncbi:hypothetical protein [Hymenobacter metallicola]|uniref:Uncharacterized protein n=1 Tax=Hymenobacter metallicola TaxID=2563114 RepID=A0A4Z0QIY6_9BACT|nr:hypothetical protein [Hymenobacter metallicola]TGE29665.1 hypothetical protein E5K02_09480 [Hymenobacter metallicola]